MSVRSRLFAIALSVFVCLATSVAAQTIHSITPAQGPTAGGTTVTIQGEFGEWPYEVIFGTTRALSTRRLNATTLEAVTPPHLPGPSSVVVFEYDRFLSTDLTFTFEGGVPTESFERLLVPILMPPVRGVFNSVFHTWLRLSSTGPSSIDVFGLEQECILTCIPPGPPWDQPLDVTSDEPSVAPNGTPGRFAYLSTEDAEMLAANLRVFDVSRQSLNFGTEIPIVRRHEFTAGPTVLLGVPTDHRFRSTLRIYADTPGLVRVTVEGQAPVDVALTGGGDLFTPAYATFNDWPDHGQPVRVTLEPHPLRLSPVVDLPIWAFVSVTNNLTQLITTISPQR
jgi:hypothetical protein